MVSAERRTVRALNIIFDRSAFHGPAFNQLAQSPLAQLTRAGKLLVHHTPVFLEETLAMYGKEKNRATLQSQIQFILSICNGDWFRTPEDIYRRELLKGQSGKALLIRGVWRKDAEDRIRHEVFSAPYWHDFAASQAGRDVEREKRDRQHAIYVEMRREIYKELSKLPVPQRRNPASWEAIRVRELDNLGSEIIQRCLGIKRAAQAARAWRAQKARYPYFSSFAEGMLYIQYWVMTKHKHIDQNAQTDIQQMGYLNLADCIVANDVGFMKDAFDVLWKPKGKVFFTTDAFVSYLQRGAIQS